MHSALIRHLESFITENRRKRFRKILSLRTRYISVVLEDLYQPHNASAVLRTCEGLGLQDIHIIEGRNKYNVNPEIALGASRWLSLHKYNTGEKPLADIFHHLKHQNYRIIATVPDSKAVPIEEFDLEKGKCAFLFGTELTGLSKEAIALADEKVFIPMYGFTESFNISVSVGICLAPLVQQLRKSQIPWQLRENEQEEIYAEWLVQSIKSSDDIIKRWKKEKDSSVND